MFKKGLFGNVRFRSLFAFLAGLVLFMAFSHTMMLRFYAFMDWRVPFNADKAGYSVYLPASLHYDWDARAFPDSIEYHIASGFILNRESGLITTKYPYGVALLQLPFYLGAESIVEASGETNTGLTRTHYFAWQLSGTFYGFLGIWIMFGVFRRHLSRWKSVLAAFILMFGTPLFYYTTIDAPMSHAYSFFLFALALKAVDILREKASWKWMFILSITAGLIIAVRHINVIVAIPLGVLLFSSPSFRAWLQTKRYAPLLMIVVISAIWLIPQLIYNQYAFGSWVKDTYENEGFNWLKPRFLYQMIGARNGLILYTPALFVSMVILIYRSLRPVSGNWKSMTPFVRTFGVFLIFFAYMTASWHAAEFGCSFSMRPYSEFSALVAFALIPTLAHTSKGTLITWASVLCLMSVFTAYMSHHWSGCAFFDGDDYSGYLNIMMKSFK